MQLTQEQYDRVADCFPKHRGSLRYDNLQALNAILYIAENGAKWRRLPEKYGQWHTIYTRMRGWAKSGVLARVFEALQQEQIIRLKVESASLDSTSVKVHPDGTGALKKTGRKALADPEEDSRPRFIWLPQMSGQHYASACQRDNAPTARKAASSSSSGTSRKGSKP
jgi:transposase